MSKIPQTKAAPAPKAPAQPAGQSIEQMMLQMNDHLRAAGDIANVLYREIIARQQMLQQMEAEPAKEAA